MTEFVDVVEVNPILFVKEIVRQIRKGFYVQNSIEGCPTVGLPYQIRLFETAEPAVRNKMDKEIHTAVVEGYDIMFWLLDVQDLAIQGFDMVLEHAEVGNFKSISMKRSEPVKLDLAPAVEVVEEKPAPKAKRAAKPTKQTTQEGDKE